MTEDEAKKKWCPHGKIGWLEECRDGVAAAAINQPYNTEYRQNCIGSDCMMWRVTDSELRPQTNREDHIEPKKYYSAGYCGLAGRP